MSATDCVLIRKPKSWLKKSVCVVGYVHIFIKAAKLRLLNFLSLFRDLQKPTRGGGVVAEFVRAPHFSMLSVTSVAK